MTVNCNFPTSLIIHCTIVEITLKSAKRLESSIDADYISFVRDMTFSSSVFSRKPGTFDRLLSFSQSWLLLNQMNLHILLESRKGTSRFPQRVYFRPQQKHNHKVIISDVNSSFSLLAWIVTPRSTALIHQPGHRLNLQVRRLDLVL